MLENVKRWVEVVPARKWRQLGKFIFGFTDVTIFVNSSDKRVKIGDSDLAYSFPDAKKAVNPWIIESLLTCVADTEPTSVSVLLYGSQKANKFSMPVEADGEIFTSTRGRASFSYRKVGRTDSGLYILHTTSNGGGSGVSHDILLLEICHKDLVKDIADGTTEQCLVLNAIGSMGLGDRFSGEVRMEEDDTLLISGWSKGQKRGH